ncbi:bifunctional pyr operon transcriptional regulator/uracil phosphoribosyltransferase PyrR [Salinisphaera sp. Q1T1-3]|uniref:bifunctional pyr operon transcriptional regulator/uracil phosphoribosyltransferase PyrR n=1 Tax=Salinisphaera sp. Q1T1-3 TaxID=2321229 RepID=UPI000E764586|nr:bifunctional pyr operon transcriptional regulator/uracil phosphoribosyltransferase PyrR [Salinisphaera sp. Q1T1-3]RJS94813.1 bifunctional pyr operon transcriptional regulator/uracil phosphoribosyltransferase PyrR [Salinisphaera sp. Q1T1-3]
MTDTPTRTYDVDAALARLTEQLTPVVAEQPDVVIVGVETGGAWIAERLHAHFGLSAPLCTINISFYRDDFSTVGLHPSVGPSHIPADIDDATVILVDDVLYTGRTVRAALNELFDYGRPAAVRLAVLVDRGTRELPFAPDAVGLTLDLPAEQRIKLTGPEPLQLEQR